MINSKTKTVLFTLLLALFSSLAQAGGSAPPATCYPLAHGEDGQGSTNSLHLPHFHTSNLWRGFIYVTNTSDEYLNIKLKFKNDDGTTYLPYSYDLGGQFNSGNSPFALMAGGAILKPGRSANLVIYDDNYTGPMNGTISWQADACIGEALVVSFRNQWSDSNRLGTTLMLLNDGQPF